MLKTYNQNGVKTFDSDLLPLSFNSYYDIQLWSCTNIPITAYINTPVIRSGVRTYTLNITPVSNYPIIVPVSVEFMSIVNYTPVFTNGMYRKIILKIGHAGPPTITAEMKLRVYVYTTGQDSPLPNDALRVRNGLNKLVFTANSKTTKVVNTTQLGVYRNSVGSTRYFVGATPSIFDYDNAGVASYYIPAQDNITPIVLDGTSKRMPSYRMAYFFWDTEADWLMPTGSLGWGLYSISGKYRMIKTMPNLYVGDPVAIGEHFSYEVFTRKYIPPNYGTYSNSSGMQIPNFYTDTDLVATTLSS